MTVEEIFSKLSAHLVKGMMAHDQFANYYLFLGLDGYKCCHEYHFLRETLSYRKIQRYYIKKYNKLVMEERVEDPKIIPDSWYKYTRQMVDVTTKRNAIKTAMEAWLKWEKDTHKMYCDFYKELEAQEEFDAAAEIKCLIMDVENEVLKIEKSLLALNDTEYSIAYIHGKQHELHEKYSEKKKCLMKY